MQYMQPEDDKVTCPKCDSELRTSEDSADLLICSSEECGFHLTLVPGYSLVKLRKIF